MNKSSRFEMRLNPDKLAAYKRQASIYGMPLSEWFESLADNAIMEEERKAEYRKEIAR